MIKRFRGTEALFISFYDIFLFIPVFIIFIVLFHGGTAFSEILEQWDISGDNVTRSNYYDVAGSKGSSPYKFEGLRSYDQFNINLTRHISPFNLWRVQMFGVVNSSEYRNKDEGIVPERLNLFHERGDGAVPYRFETGDLYAYFSYRTLQRPLKGLQMELQPFSSYGSRRIHSILFVTGTYQPSWRHFQAEDNYTNGLSYFVDDPFWGRWGLNIVHNTRQGDITAGTLRRTQYVYSIGGERSFLLASHKINIETELSQFKGDHNGTSGAASGQGRHDTGIYFQITGKGKLPYSYRARYEAYGYDYRPAGSVVPPGRGAWELHLGWFFTTGLHLRGRVQNFRDNWETSNPRDTRIYGLNLSGPLLSRFINNLTGSVDTFLQDVEDKNKTKDHVVKVVNINLIRPIYGNWNGRLGLFYRGIDQQVTGSSSTTLRQISLAADHPASFYGFNGSISTGFVIRKLHTPNRSVELFPALGIFASKGPHVIGYNMSFNQQDRKYSGGIDTDTLSHTFSYRYNLRQDTIGVEFTNIDRNPDPGQSTASYLVSVFWQHSFSRPAKVHRVVQSSRMEWGKEFRLIDLRPGMKLDKAKRRLLQAGIKGESRLAGAYAYETRLFETIDRRQRLVLIPDGKTLKKTLIIIEPDRSDTPADIMRIFEEIRSILIERYGTPSNFFEKGMVNKALWKNINTGEFVRVSEWNVPGGIIRFGIPRRLDRQIRIEIQFAEEFPSIRDTFWSIEAIN